MSSTFSTVINFGMLGLLHRLHRLHTQFCLEAECGETAIKYPCVEAHKFKDGHSKHQQCNTLPTDEEIFTAIEKSRKEAQKVVEDLGMGKQLKDNECWEYPPIQTIKEEDMNEGSDDDDDDCDDHVETKGDEMTPYLLQEPNVSDNSDKVLSGIAELKNVGFIDKGLCEHLTSLHNATFKRLPSASLPIYEVKDNQQCKVSSRKSKKFSPYIEISHNGKSAFIHKTTAVWLLQEGERVSSDRLFRVRAKQPFSCEVQHQMRTPDNTPTVCSTIQVGDICVFKASQGEWRLGRILQFSYFREKTKKATQYSGSIVDLSSNTDKIGVLCSWYTPNKSTSVPSPPTISSSLTSPPSSLLHTQDLASSDLSPPALRSHTLPPTLSGSSVSKTSTTEPSISQGSFSLACSESVHAYQPVSSYLCTVSTQCFHLPESDNAASNSILAMPDDYTKKLATTQNVSLNTRSLEFIESLLDNQSTTEAIVINNDDNLVSKSRVDNAAANDHWLTIGKFVLTKGIDMTFLEGKS